MSTDRPVTARPYTWHAAGHKKGEPIPGVLLRVSGRSGSRIFVPLTDAHALADQLHDLAEQHELNESTNTEQEH